MAYNTNGARHTALSGDYDISGSFRRGVRSGKVTTLAADGIIFTLRWPSSTHKMLLKYVGARFTTAVAYGTAQETGCYLQIARSYTVNGTNGTALDFGSTLTGAGKSLTAQSTSKITAGCARVATTAVVTAGTIGAADPGSIGTITGWAGALGALIPASPSRGDGYGTLFDARLSTHEAPLVFAQNEGFEIKNLVLMGATGEGFWDFLLEWDEGIPH